MNEEAGFEEGIVGSGIKPGHAAAHDFNIQGVVVKIVTVEISDFSSPRGDGLRVEAMPTASWSVNVSPVTA